MFIGEAHTAKGSVDSLECLLEATHASATKVKKKKALEVLQDCYCVISMCYLEDVSAVHRVKEHNNEHMIVIPCYMFMLCSLILCTADMPLT